MLFSFKKKQEQFIKKKTRFGRRRTSAVGRVPTNYNFLNFIIMIKVNAIVTSARAYDVNGVINVKISTNAKFDGFVRHVDNVTGVISFERCTTDSIVMSVSQLLHFVNENSPLYAYLFAGISPINISQKGWRDLFLGAKITFTRVFEPAGTEYVDSNGEHKTTKGDRFDTQILSIEPCDLNNAIIFDMERTPAMVMTAINAAKTVQPVITEDTATEPTDDEVAEAE